MHLANSCLLIIYYSNLGALFLVVEPCSCGETKREIDETVGTFYQNISTMYDTLRKRHMEELHSFMIKARKNFKQQRLTL